MIERLVAWYQISSSVGAVIALIAANAIPLLGVLLFGWNVWTILIVYWLENGIVGAFNIAKMARAQGDSSTAGMRMNGRPLPAGAGAKAALIPFFLIHYGLFWAVHGVFVLTLPLFAGIGGTIQPSLGDPSFGDPGFGEPGFGEPSGPIPGPELTAGFDLGTIILALIGLTVSHGLSFLFNYLRGGEYRRVSAAQLMFAPYGRLVVLHITIILGAMAVSTTGAAVVAVAILVVLKTIVDLGFHLAEHRKVAALPPGTVAGV